MSGKIMILANHDITIYFFRKELVHKLIDDGYHVFLCCPRGEYTSYFEELGCEVIDVEVNRRGVNPFSDVRLYRTYVKVLEKYQPDLLLSYTVKPNIYGMLASRKIETKRIATVTGIGSGIYQGQLLAGLIKYLYRKAFKHVNHVFFQNQDNKNLFLNHQLVTAKKTVLVNGSGVNLQAFPYQNYISRQEEGARRIVYIGRVMAEKGILEFIYAAKVLRQNYEKVSFHIYGMFDDDSIEQAVRNSPINYHGAVKDVQAVIGSSGCIVLPSYHEGMSNVVLEASATGRVTIASDIPGCQEIIADGQTGFLVPVKDKLALTEAIEQVINLPISELTKMGSLGE